MITGNIEEGLYPRIQTTIIAPSGNSAEKVLVDTGFDGEVAMHYDDADRFQLELVAPVDVQYASGDEQEELYCYGKILWFGETRKVEILLSSDNERSIGTLLLDGCIMTMNFIQNTVTIDKP